MLRRSDHKLLRCQCVLTGQFFLATSRFTLRLLASTRFLDSFARQLGQGRLIEFCVTDCGSCFPAQPAGPRGSGTVPLVRRFQNTSAITSGDRFSHRPPSLHVCGSGRVPSLADIASDCKRISHKIYLLKVQCVGSGSGRFLVAGKAAGEASKKKGTALRSWRYTMKIAIMRKAARPLRFFRRPPLRPSSQSESFRIGMSLSATEPLIDLLVVDIEPLALDER